MWEHTSPAFLLEFFRRTKLFYRWEGYGEKRRFLHLIEYALSQRCKSREALDFLCAHDNTYILYDILFENKTLSTPESVINIRSLNGGSKVVESERI